jgi:hypothetical protein
MIEADLIALALSLSYRLVKILIAFFLLFAVLRLFDYIAQKKFNLFELIDDQPVSAALYYGLRFVGASYLVASVWGV